MESKKQLKRLAVHVINPRVRETLNICTVVKLFPRTAAMTIFTYTQLQAQMDRNPKQIFGLIFEKDIQKY